MASGSHATRRSTVCPRCGYDLVGTIDAWTDQCPLEGTCTECGLQFAWNNVLVPGRRLPAWCVEYGRPRSLWHRIPRTVFKAMWPWAFWRSLQMHHGANWSRLGTVAIVLFGVLYTAFIASHTASYGGVVSQRTAGAAAWGAMATPDFLEWWGGPVDATLLFQVADDPLNDSLRRVGGRRMRTSSRDLLEYRWSTAGTVLGAFMILHLLTASGFVVLPVSRRRAKVRWSHLGRIVCYGCLLPIPSLLLWMLAGATIMQPMRALTGLGELLGLVAAAMAWLMVPLIVIWWSTATGRFLRMPHAWGVGLLLVVLSGLVMLAVAATIDPMGTVWWTL